MALSSGLSSSSVAVRGLKVPASVLKLYRTMNLQAFVELVGWKDVQVDDWGLWIKGKVPLAELKEWNFVPSQHQVIIYSNNARTKVTGLHVVDKFSPQAGDWEQRALSLPFKLRGRRRSKSK